MSRVEPERNKYVGHRYVPKIFGEWDKQNEYEGLSIVTHKGNSYTSKKRVPVGIDILNEEFWVVTGNYDAQVEHYRQDVRNLDNRLTGEMSDLDDKLTGEMSDLDSKLTGEMSDLDGKVSVNEGKINKTIDEMYKYSNSVNEIYIKSDSNVEGDGSKVLPYSKISDGFEHIKKLTDKGAEGKWIIRLSGTFNEGYRIIDMPNVRETIEIVGDTTVSGDPDTILSGLDINSVNGLWFEPAGNLNVIIKNIIFKDYRSYAVIMKDQGKLLVDNCIFNDCYFGVGGVNQNRTTVHHSTFNRCETGVVSQYGSTLTVGSTANTDYRKCTFNECRYGVSISRNSVAHIDYCEFNNSTISGVTVNESSRVNCVSNIFESNHRGVTVNGGGEWQDSNNVFNNSVEFDYQHFGTGKETRLYSQRTNVEYVMPLYTPLETVFKGNTENTAQRVATLPTYYKIPKGFFKGEGKKLKIVVYGAVNKNPNNAKASLEITTVVSETGTLSASLGISPIEGTSGSFIYELTSINTKENQLTKNVTMSNRANNIVAVSTRTTPTVTDRQVRVIFKCDDPEMEVTIRAIEFIQAG